MFPSFDQVQHAAYHRWERRQYSHGHDREDWLAAEQELLFQLNYKVLVQHRPVDGESRVLGNKARPVCRFCERSAPGTQFGETTLALPEFLGDRSFYTFEECEECRSLFGEGIEADLEEFLSPLRDAPGPRVWGRSWMPIPVPALKGLTKLGLSILPRRELEGCEGAIEWVSNPDHDFDASLFSETRGYLHVNNDPVDRPWVALAGKTDLDAPMPSFLVFLGIRHVVLQVALPLCDRDEDIDGSEVIVPRVSWVPFPNWSANPFPVISLPLCLADARAVVGAR